MDIPTEDIQAHDSSQMIEILKKLTLEEKAIRFFNFLNFTREMQWAGIQMRNPTLSKEEIDNKFREEMMAYYKNN
jgi:hypothetical protein